MAEKMLILTNDADSLFAKDFNDGLKIACGFGNTGNAIRRRR